MEDVTGNTAGFTMTRGGIIMDIAAGGPITATVIAAIKKKTCYPSGTCRPPRPTGNTMIDARGRCRRPVERNNFLKKQAFLYDYVS